MSNKKFFILFSGIILGLLSTFSVWSHFSQDKELKNQANKLNSVVIQGGENLLVGASGFFAQNASVQLNLEVLGTYASTSGNLSFNGEIMPDGATCSNTQILKRTAANDWDCVADAGATEVTLAGVPDYITISGQEITRTKLDISDDTNMTAGTDLTLTANNLTLDSTLTQAYSFTSTGSQSMTGSLNVAKGFHQTGSTFDITADGRFIGYNTGSSSFAGSLNVTKGLVANRYSGGGLTDCLSAGNVLRFNLGPGFSCATLADTDIPDTISLIGGTIGANSISGLQTTTGTLTFGDNGDNIVFDSNTWDITGAGAGSGFTQFTVDNLDLNTNSFTSTTGGITIAPNSLLTNFTGSASLSLNFEAIGYASASSYFGTAFGGIDCNDAADQLLWSGGVFTCEALADGDIPDGITVSGGTLGANTISSGVTWTTTGTLTVGDNGDRVDFDTSGWDVANSVFSGVTGMTGTGVWDLGGATSFEIPQNGTVDATGEITTQTTSNSFDWYNGTRIVVQREQVCFTYVVDTPTAANPGRVQGKRFDDPFTLTSVQPVASGSNAAGWNLLYGPPGTVTTSVFTLAKSASTSSYPTYTSFANSTLLDGNNLDLIISSRSAVLQTFSVNVCGRYSH